MNLKLKLAIGTILLTGSGVLAVGAFSYRYTKSVAEEETKFRGRLLVQNFIAQNFESIEQKNELNLWNGLQDLLKQVGVIYGIVLDKDGQVIADTEIYKVGRIDSEMPARLSASKDNVIIENAKINNQELLIITTGVKEKPAPKAGEAFLLEGLESSGPKIIAAVQIGLSREAFLAFRSKVRKGMTVIAAIILVCTLIFSLLFSFIITQPLKKLLSAIEEMSAGNLDVRVDTISKDELGRVVRAFNKMAMDLKEAWEKTEEQNSNLEQRVSERTKELEQVYARMLQSEKMAAVGQLAGGMSHELNNPLGVILGFAQSIVRRIEKDDPLNYPLKSIEREAFRCKDMVQNLLTFSRISNPEEREDVDINTAVNQALALIQGQIKVKNIELVQELGEDLPNIRANRNQIQQVVVNLCNNAIDAMQNNGKLTVRTGHVMQREAAWVFLEVCDTGAGIPKEIQSKIYEPFFTTKEVGKGTGLGLSLVYEIVKKHNGQIELVSKAGQGATFTVHIPACV